MLRVGFERRTQACESRALTYRAPMLGKEGKGCGTDLYHLYIHFFYEKLDRVTHCVNQS